MEKQEVFAVAVSPPGRRRVPGKGRSRTFRTLADRGLGKDAAFPQGSGNHQPGRPTRPPERRWWGIAEAAVLR